MSLITTINANAIELPFNDGVFQCVVTSPPYWGLRDYGTAIWENGSAECDHVDIYRPQRGHNGRDFGDTRGDENSKTVTKIQYIYICSKCGARRIDAQIGLESTPALYVANIVKVMREVWRVGRPDMTVWLNLGDSFSDKQLTGIPWRVAFALQDDGWYLRSDIIWSKPNPMPESVTDRPTKAHEYVFLLSKQSRYYYDNEAIKETSIYPDDDRKNRSEIGDKRMPTDIIAGIRPGSATYATRNRRSVWTVATSPYSGAHFATFPPALVEPMILAGTSQRGACPTCGAGWVRVVEIERGGPSSRLERDEIGARIRPTPGGHEPTGTTPGSDTRGLPSVSSNTLGWRPACACYAAPPLPDELEDVNGNMEAYRAERARVLDIYAALPTVPQMVLDPFAGTATVGRVCAKLGRSFVGTELNLKYIALADERTSGVQVTMPL